MLATIDEAAHQLPIDQLWTAVGECLRIPAPRGSYEQTGDTMRELRQVINRLELVFARQAARLAAVSNPEHDEDPVQWMRAACRMTSHAAGTALAVGQYEEQLPRSVDSFLSGTIGIAHLGLLAGTADFALSGPQPRAAGFDETALLASAERKTVYHFRKDCYHAQHAIDAAACTAAAVDDVNYRRLRLHSCEDGGVALSGYLDSEGGALLRTALEPLARRSVPHEHRSREQRLGDALVELAAHRLDSGDIPQRASQRSHLQVTASIETLRGVPGAPGAELEYGGCIPAATVQRLACDSTITRVLFNSESAVIDVGRAQRVVPPATRRALNVRDKGCRWPGCDRPAPWTAAHHVVHWVHDGPTSMSNLLLLCHRHHGLIHEGGYQIVRSDDGSILTIPPRPHLQPLPAPPV